ncbi:Serine/threonine-protein phosphatase 7 long form homolog [Linum grandiflorum]
MERWRPETNTFHMYHGEVSISLQDVAHLTGLSVSDDALIEGGPTSTSAGNIGGWMVLLQAWCLERFPSIARRMHERGLRRPQSRTPPLIARLVSIILN